MSDIAEDVDIEAELKKAEEEAENQEEKQAEPDQTEAAEQPDEQPDETEQAPDESEDKKQRKVDHGALHAERERRKAIQAELEEFRNKYSTLEERLNAINEQISRKDEPSYEDDPDAYLKSQVEKTGQSLEEVRAQIAENAEKEKQIGQRQELANRIVSSENAFREEYPDYDEAVAFLRKGRAREFEAMGYNDPIQIEQMLVNEAFALAQQADRQDMTPAQLAYQVALARGYTKPANGEDKKLEKVQQGQSRSKSLSGAGGESEMPLDPEALASMTDEEFAAAMKKGVWGKVVGSS